MNKKYRYPGSRPFQDDLVDRMLYFGRENEKQLLFHRILSEQLIVLFARSGIGKTSLIQAGVMELLRLKGYLPIIIRFNIENITPLQSVVESIKTQAIQSPFEINIDESAQTLWDFIHSLEIWTENEDLMDPVLIFDQFEEFFTLHEKKQRDVFVSNLSHILSGIAPSDDTSMFQSPPDVKMVISIREDYLAELDELSSLIPGIFQKRMRLLPLSKKNAREAILSPAAVKHDCMHSHPFTYSDNAMDEMLHFLCKQKIRGQIRETDEIESFQLQLLCSFLEDKIIQKQTKAPDIINSSDLGGDEGMNNVMIHYYEGVLNSLDNDERKKARKLCEEYLISHKDRRLSKEVEEIAHDCGVSKNLLQKLVHSRLLRSEPRVGSDYFELCHDTLVPAIKQFQKEHKGKLNKVADFLSRARKLSNNYNTDQAIDTYIELLKEDNQQVDAYLELGDLLQSKYRYDEAIKLYQRAIENQIKHPSLFLKLGRAFLQKEKADEAIEQFKAAISLKNDFLEAHIKLGQAYILNKDFSRAIDQLERALSIDDKSQDAYKQLCFCYIDQGNPVQALKTYQKSIDKNVLNAYIFFDLRKLFKEKLLNQHLIELYDIAEKVELDDTGYYHNLGYYMDDFKCLTDYIDNKTMYKRQISLFSKAIQLDPKYVHSINTLGNALSGLGKKEEAIEKYQQAIQIDSEYAHAYNGLGSALSNLGKKEEAIEKYQQAIQIDPEYAHAYNNWGSVLSDLGKKEEAIEKYQQTIQIDPEYVDAYNDWGLALSDLGRNEEAIEKYQQAIQIDPEYVHAYNNWGNALLGLGKNEEAIEKFQQALSIDPNYYNAKANLSELYFISDDFIQTEKQLRELLEIKKMEIDIELAIRQLLFSSLLFQNKCQEALNELNDLISFYENLTEEYYRECNYSATKTYIQEHDGISENERNIQLKLIEILEMPKDQGDIQMKQLKKMRSTLELSNEQLKSCIRDNGTA
jgi:tetratricopeptide (TPR) repeat protein